MCPEIYRRLTDESLYSLELRVARASSRVLAFAPTPQSVPFGGWRRHFDRIGVR